ncbi:MAG: hypothetical protein ACK4HC_02115 [Cloacibacterium sp.]
MNNFLLVLQIVTFIALFFVALSEIKGKPELEAKKGLFNNIIVFGAFILLLEWMKSPDLVIYNIEQANKELVGKNKSEIIKLMDKPDLDQNYGGEHYYVYIASKNGAFRQFDDAGDSKNLRIYFEGEYCYSVSID